MFMESPLSKKAPKDARSQKHLHEGKTQEGLDSQALPAAYDDSKDLLSFPQEELEGLSAFVVERDPFYRNFIGYALKKIIRYVEFIPDGITAFKRAKIRKPDLIVCDPIAAKVNSIQFCRWIREDPVISSTPILIYSELSLEEKFEDSNGISFLKKPFKEEELLKAVKQLTPADLKIRS